MTFEQFCEHVRETHQVEAFATHGPCKISLRDVLRDLFGTVNVAPFCGKPPGTVLLRHVCASPGLTLFRFDYRPLPWAYIWTAEGEQIRFVDPKGRPLYEEGDFSPLPEQRYRRSDQSMIAEGIVATLPP